MSQGATSPSEGEGEDRVDADHARRILAKIESGEEELIPAAVVDRILAGESRVRVWREHRGLSVRELAQTAGVKPADLEAIEAGGVIDPDVTSRIAGALRIDVEDLAPATP